jgi:hypothetical protein
MTTPPMGRRLCIAQAVRAEDTILRQHHITDTSGTGHLPLLGHEARQRAGATDRRTEMIARSA